MKKHLICLCALALAAVAVLPSVASATTVDLRVEGATQTLLPETTVTLPTAPILKDGTDPCAADSVGGALTASPIGTNWAAPFTSYGYFLSGIKGEAPSGDDYWTIWVNHKSSMNGVCDGGSSAGLQQGDDVLLFVDTCHVGPAPDYLCTNDPVLPLAVSAPTTAAPGAPFTVTVTRYDQSGASAPVAGATVTGGAAPVTTDAAGHAAVTLAAGGPATLTATKDNFARVATSVCGTTGTDGLCGTVKPPPAPDTTAPYPRLTGLKQHVTYARRKAPRDIRGTVNADPSGIESVELRIVRNVKGKCAAFDGASETWKRTKRCSAEAGRWFSAGDRQTFDYQLPAKLTKGRYVVDVRAADGAGNVSTGQWAGLSRFVFHVK